MVPRIVRMLAALAPAVLILTACQNPLLPKQETVLGVSKVEAPATVVAAQPFTVKLTVNFGGCVRFDRFETRGSGSQLEVTAVGIDNSGRNMACPDVLFSVPHDLTVPGASPGTLKLIVRQPDGSTIEREVQVVGG